MAKTKLKSPEVILGSDLEVEDVAENLDSDYDPNNEVEAMMKGEEFEAIDDLTSEESLPDVVVVEEKRLSEQETDLIRGVIGRQDIEPDVKVEAISAISKEMISRVVLTGKNQNNDLDYLVIKSIQTQDSPSFFEKTWDKIKKRKLTAEARSGLSDSDFALVKTKDGKKVRKYPIHDKSHVRNALSRAAQMIKSGGQAAKDARAALPKIRAAARKLGIEMSPSKEFQNAFVVEKDASGNWRWIGWVSNNYRDRDGEIITRKAHEEYVQWLDDNPDLSPVMVIWHTPGTKSESDVDYWAYENDFLIMSGPLTEKEAQGFLEVASESVLGMSHGFFSKKKGKEIVKYRTYEVSVLPLSKAANIWTSFDAIIKEAKMKDRLEFLSKIMGEDKAEAFLEKTGLMKEALDEAGVDSKDSDVDVEDAPETPAGEQETTFDPEMKEVLDQLSEQLGLKDLSEWMQGVNTFMTATAEGFENLSAKLDGVEQKQADGIAAAYESPISKAMKINKPSQDDGNTVDEDADKELLNSQPGLKKDAAGGWLSNVTGTEAIAAE